ESEHVTFAVNEVCNLAEILINSDSSLSSITEYYPLARVSSDEMSATVFFDSSFKETTAENAKYRMDVTEEPSDTGTDTNIDYFLIDEGESSTCLYSVNLFTHSQISAEKGGQ
ncbi:MAG: hypothetical protein K6E13_10385, partial [Lachnospiraceae bacterium]|nr:hypothetical protein [Lachnospiraceae bacterium]